MDDEGDFPKRNEATDLDETGYYNAYEKTADLIILYDYRTSIVIGSSVSAAMLSLLQEVKCENLRI